jgi:hypothetical protein
MIAKTRESEKLTTKSTKYHKDKALQESSQQSAISSQPKPKALFSQRLWFFRSALIRVHQR